MGEADFWSNSEKAQATVAELKTVNTVLKPLDEALAVGRDLEALEELAREDESLEGELATEADRLTRLVANSPSRMSRSKASWRPRRIA